MSVSVIFFFATLACMVFVALSLVGGMAAMTKDTEASHRTSNKMMRLRVFFQGLAILFLFFAYMTK